MSSPIPQPTQKSAESLMYIRADQALHEITELCKKTLSDLNDKNYPTDWYSIHKDFIQKATKIFVDTSFQINDSLQRPLIVRFRETRHAVDASVNEKLDHWSHEQEEMHKSSTITIWGCYHK